MSSSLVKCICISVVCLTTLSMSASFSDDVAVFQNQMRYDAAFVVTNMDKIFTTYELLHQNMPMVGHKDSRQPQSLALSFPASSSIANIYSALEPSSNDPRIGHLNLYVVFKDVVDRQNINHLVASKVLKYTALGSRGENLAIPLTKTFAHTAQMRITAFSCERVSDSKNLFATFVSKNETIDLVHLLPYPFNYCR